ncbi:MAG: sorbosone dehydrogenase [Candidatus Hydrogenedentota bacterium]|nr:MAG: sorbosone dehydrogenase [Candidatus Hydrogenedentota bacterium]
MSRLCIKFVGFVLAILVSDMASADLSEQLKQIKLPSGFEISVYAEELGNPRQMTLGAKGTVFVGNRNGTKVYALVDSNGDNKADKTYVVFDTAALPEEMKVKMPSGVAFKDGALYIGAINYIFRLDDIENNLDDPPKPVIVVDDFPDTAHHGWRFIAFGPDGKLYVPVGSPCNVCEKDEEIFGTITRINPDGSGREIVAKGIRNTLGFDWHPKTGELWFTENGTDGMGDDVPADELNRITKKGQHFGYPYVHQGDILDKRFGRDKKIKKYKAPAQNLAPHAAALGMRFYTGDMFPPEYKNQIFIAEHGSSDRSVKLAYSITTVFLDDKGKAIAYEPFAEGWLQGDTFWGRPTDVMQMPDGSLLVSDTDTKAIYRIAYTK